MDALVGRPRVRRRAVGHPRIAPGGERSHALAKHPTMGGRERGKVRLETSRQDELHGHLFERVKMLEEGIDSVDDGDPTGPEVGLGLLLTLLPLVGPEPRLIGRNRNVRPKHNLSIPLDDLNLRPR